MTTDPRAHRVAGLLGVILLATSGTTGAQASDAALELAKLKAAYVLNFARFTAWPETAFADPSSPITIGITGDDRLRGYLEAMVEDERVEGRRIVVRDLDLAPLDVFVGDRERAALADRLRELHVLFIGSTTARRLSWLFDRLEDHHVLTVSDIQDFAERGGMIGLVIRNRRLAFDANVEQMRRHQVSVSSQVLRLARIVGDRSS